MKKQEKTRENTRKNEIKKYKLKFLKITVDKGKCMCYYILAV